MACQHVAIVLGLVFFWVIIGNTYAKREPNVRSQLRPTRGLEQMDLSTARGFGKRAVNMHFVNNFLLEWIALETRMRSLGYPRHFRKPQDIVNE